MSRMCGLFDVLIFLTNLLYLVCAVLSERLRWRVMSCSVTIWGLSLIRVAPDGMLVSLYCSALIVSLFVLSTVRTYLRLLWPIDYVNDFIHSSDLASFRILEWSTVSCFN